MPIFLLHPRLLAPRKVFVPVFRRLKQRALHKGRDFKFSRRYSEDGGISVRGWILSSGKAFSGEMNPCSLDVPKAAD